MTPNVAGVAPALDFLTPGGGLQGPLFASLLDRLLRGPAERAPGSRVGPYRIAAKLGHGGMAIVYLAERADGEFEQRVALKLVRPDHGVSAEDARELLRRERQILAGLQHPRIARLLDGGTTDDGALWFAMEAVEGERIDRWCEARRAPLSDRLGLFLQVCDAVQFAHAHLLVHRDLKPSNILVTRDGEVKLLDFGIAAIAQPGLEASGPRAMTPGFASPEQRRGEAETTASDVWQLGRLLEVVALGAVPPRRDRDLRAIATRAMRDDTTRRYAGVGELASDVRRLLERRPVQARGGGPLYRARRFVERHFVSSAIAGVALGAIVALAATFALRLAEERDAASRAAERANAAVGFLVGVFGANDPRASRGATLDAKALLARGVERLERELAGEPELEATLLLAIARIHDSLGDSARARELLDRAIALGRASGEPDRGMLAETMLTRAEVGLHLGRPLEVLAELAAVEPAIDAGSEAGRRQRVRLLGTRAMASMGSGNLAAALASEQEALRLARELEGPDGDEVAARNHDLGIIWRAQRRFDDAARAFDEARRIYLARHGADHPLHVSAQKNLATALLELGELDRAEPMLRAAVEHHRVLYDGKGALYAAALRSLAHLETKLGRPEAALAAFDRSVALMEEALGSESTALAYSLTARGDAYAATGRLDAALEDHRRAYAMRAKLLPSDHPDRANSAAAIAVLAWRAGQAQDAIGFADEALEIRMRRLPEDDPATLKAWVLGGLARAAAGDAAAAQSRYDEARRRAVSAESKSSVESWIADPDVTFGPRAAPAPPR